jgi:hypothetical protein
MDKFNRNYAVTRSRDGKFAVTNGKMMGNPAVKGGKFPIGNGKNRFLGKSTYRW